jgi:hypothetical protein
VQRAEKIGLGASATGHLLLLLALSLGILAHPRPLPDMHEAMDVELITSAAPTVTKKAVAPAASAPPAPEEPAPAPPTPKPTAPPPPTPTPKPEPKPEPVPVIKPKPEVKPAPKPKPAPEKTKPEKPKPVKPKPVKPKPEKPKPEKPRPEKSKPEKPKPEARPAKPTPTAKPAPVKQRLGKDFLKGLDTSVEKAAAASGKGKTPSARPKAQRIGKDFLKSLSTEAKKETAGAPAAKISALQMRNIAGLIGAQIAPCYHPVTGGAGTASIRTTLELRLNKDGTLSSAPKVTDQTGLTPENRAYAQQVAEAARRAVLRCSPLRLPADQYTGGWEWITPSFTPADLGQ